jgi:hypothetical protein
MKCNRCDVVLTEENQPPSWRKTNRSSCKNCSKENNQSSNPDRMFINGKYIPKTHPLHKAGNYKSFGDLAFGSLNNYKQIKEGYVYAISNSAWPDWIKIGMAIDAEDRLSSYQTSSPMRNYRLVHSVYCKDRSESERSAHILAARKANTPWSKQDNGEWFNITESEAVDILKEIAVD